MPSIRYVKRAEIDTNRWNRCIDTAPNGLIYGYAFYLDALCDQWDALVQDDYAAVMPLPWRKKMGFHYLYQPFLTPQLGVMGKAVTPALLESFLEAVPAKFRYWHLPLNYRNVFSLRYTLQQRTNYVLDLSPPYDKLQQAYRENIRRNIRRANNARCTFKKDMDVSEVILLARQQPGQTLIMEDLERFEKLYRFLHAEQRALTYGAFSAEGLLLASCVFFFSHNRAYYIFVGNHPRGRTVGASHFLIDAFIREFAGKQLKLDFEGSDLPGLAFFYSSFGAAEEPYAVLRLNRLPWYLRWLKR